MDTAPLIGITTSYEAATEAESARIVLNANYISAVERAGGVPIVLPTFSSLESSRIALSKIDGLIIPGGPGISEGLIGELPEDLAPVAPERTQSDRFAFESAQERELPMLGICYGMQFINAQLGGTIYGDAEHEIGTQPHHPKRTPDDELEHAVSIEPGSRLRDVIENPSPVNSFHIQAVAELGEGLRASLRSEDGLVEGLESEDGRIVGVQFHPEKMPESEWDKLFVDLVTRCQDRLGRG